MNDHLRDLLTPADDGRAFTDAVLFKASGALHRRRAAAESSALPALGWLERWARPWVLAALVLVTLAVLFPNRPWGEVGGPVAAVPADSDAMAYSLLPADLAVAVTTEGR
jgi:hypothetical protein